MDIYTLALSIAYSNKIGKQIKDQAFKTQIESNRDILNTTGEEKIFYFLPKENGKPQNGYDEYIYFNNNWELMGGTDIDLSNYMTLAPLNPTAEQIAALPSGQLYGDTANHKAVIKGGQEFYDITATNNLILKKLVPDVTINNPPVRYATAGDLYTIGTVLHVNISGSEFGYAEYDVVLESITTVVEGEQYIYNWKRVGCAPVCFTANGTGFPSSGRMEYEGHDTPLKRGDFVIKRFQSEPAIIYVCDMVQDSQSGTKWGRRHQSYSWKRLASYGTKLADYGINNAYTKTEIDQKGFLTLETLPIYDGTVI